MNNSKMLASKMKQLAILCLMFTGALCISPALAEKPKSDGTLKQKASKQEIAQKLDPYFQTLADNNRLLGRFALYHGNHKLYSSTLEANGEKSKKTDAQFKYKIGSITKTFTAVLVFQLIEEGKLSLDTTLDAYYPEVANAKQITIKQMLNHHSGIHSYTDDPKFIDYHMSPQDKTFLVNKIESFDADFKPGENAAYSNSNYLLLGYIAEQIDGKPYAEMLQERIYKAVGMENTLLGAAINPENAEAYSYQFNGGKWQEVPQWDMSVAYSAGALVSTADDLNLFIKGLFDGDLISKDSLEQMIELDDGFGKGIFATKYQLEDSELKGYWHNGGIEAFVSHMAYYPEKDLTVVVLTNGMSYDMRKIYETMLDAHFGKEVVLPEFGKAVELDEALLKPLAGEYKSETHPLDINLSVVDGKLFAQATGQGGFPLTPLSKNQFEFIDAGIEIRFDRENHQFEIKQGGRADIFIKSDEAKKEKKLEVPTETLEKYVGTYSSDSFPLDIEVMIKNGQLYAQATGQSAFPLTPVTNNKFKFTLADIVIEFDVKKRHLTITQRGQPRIMQKQ